jgi:acetyl-CoA C-acetyltransferase
VDPTPGSGPAQNDVPNPLPQDAPNDAAVIVAARRTPIGTAGHALRSVPVDRLTAPVLRALVDDLGVAPEDIADVVLGNLMGPGGNVARVAALAAGLGPGVTGLTVDRQCASGLEAINLAAALVRAGCGDLYLAGGAESPSTAPWRLERPAGPTALPRPYDRAPFAPADVGDPDMGVAAETVAREAEVSRERQDAYAAESHARAVAAQKAGLFDDELVPVAGLAGDERPRAGLTAARLARFPAAFVRGGTVTAANSCGINDGAAAVAVASESWRAARKLPGLRIIGWEVAGVDPNRCGLGAVPAVERLLGRTGLTAADIGVVEITEAFAGQVLACLDALGVDRDRACPDGGALALGHPWAASGAILVVRLFSRMVRQGGPRFGLAACAVGGGMGVATLVERVT